MSMEFVNNNKLIKVLEKQGIFINHPVKPVKKTAVLFPGHGSQYPNMLRDLLEDYDVAKDIFKKADRIFSQLDGRTLTKCIFYEQESQREAAIECMKEATVMQTSIYTCSYILYQLVTDLGVKADYLCGHSLGEITALAAAESIRFEEGFKIVYYRAQSLNLLESTKRGSMISIALDKQERQIKEMLHHVSEYATVSLYNGPKQSVISGTIQAVDEIEAFCKKENIMAHRLNVSHAFHSELLKDCVRPYYEKLKEFHFEKPKKPIYSTILSGIYSDTMFKNKEIPRILAEQLVTPFSFKDIIEDLYEQRNVNVFVEAGAKNILSKLTGNILAGKDVYITETNQEKMNDLEAFQRAEAYMLINNLLNSPSNVQKTIDGDEKMIEERLRKIISYPTGYPEEILTITDEPLKLAYALNDSVFKEVLNGIKREFDLNDLPEGVSAAQIVKMYNKKSEGKKENRNGTSITYEEVRDKIKNIVEEMTGYPASILEDELEFEADLGIDSVKQGEIFTSIGKVYDYAADNTGAIKDLNTIHKITEYIMDHAKAVEVPRETMQTEKKESQGITETVKTLQKAYSRKQIAKDIKKIIVDFTGYPFEVLEEDFELEADLGIDSVKQGEIIIQIKQKYNYEFEDGINLSQLNTIGKIIDYSLERTSQAEAKEEETSGVMVYSKEAMTEVSEKDIEKKVKDIISDETGYPIEMLESTFELEADLGIDSVKQGEILSVLNKEWEILSDVSANIKELNTIEKIAKYIVAGISGFCDSKKDAGKEEKKTINFIEQIDGLRKNHDTNRFIAIPVERDYDESLGKKIGFKGKHVVLIEDRLTGAVTKKLADKLVEDGATVCVVGRNIGYSVNCVEVNDYSVTALQKCFAKARAALGNQVDVILNLQSLSEQTDFQTASYEAWSDEITNVYNMLFYSAKMAYDCFEKEPEQCAYLAVTNIGGIFGYEEESLHNPVGAITAGFVKGLEKELRPLYCKVVDFSDLVNVEEVSALIYKEITLKESLVEIGYCNGQRKTVCVIPKEIPEREYKEPLKLDEKDVIVVSGGARGIIYQCVKAIQKVYNPTIIVTGRSPLPTGEEEWIHMDEEAFQAYKTIYIKKLMTENKNIRPIEANNRYESLKNAREMYYNICEEKQRNIHYMQCDANSYEDVKCMIEQVKQKYGNITGVINGAGLPSFGKIDRKVEAHALQVVKVKANGFYNFYHACKDQPLKFFMSIGSISGRFGMDGQSDYSAGADIIVRLSCLLKKMHVGFKPTVIGWSAWSDVGMASNEAVKKVQNERGLQYMGVNEGEGQFLNELLYGMDYPETLIFGAIGDSNMPLGQLDLLDEKFQKIIKPVGKNGEIHDRTKYAMLDRVVSFEKGKKIVALKKLDQSLDVHLRDHTVGGDHVLAGVMHLECLSELCELLRLESNPEDPFHLHKIENYEFIKFIKSFDKNELTLKAEAEIIEETEMYRKVHVSLKSDFVNRKGIVLERDRLHSQGTFIYTLEKPKADKAPVDFEKLMAECREVDIEKYYRQASAQIEFGETFRCIPYAGLVGKDEMVGIVEIKNDEANYTYIGYADSVLSPVTIDNIGRLMLFKKYQEGGWLVVPTNIKESVCYRPFRKGEKIYVYAKEYSDDNTKVEFMASVYDESGKLIFDLGRMELTRIGENEKGEHNILK